MTSLRQVRLVPIVIALALVTAACGGDDGGADTTTTIAATTTTTASGDGAEATTTTTESMSGDSGSEWCDRIRSFQESNEESPLSFNFFGMTAEQIQAQFEANLGVFEEWASVAPPEIDEDVDTVVAAFRLLYDRAEAAEWDLATLADDETFMTAFDEPALDEATSRIDAYSRDVCGVDFTTMTDPGSAPPTGGDDPISIALDFFGLPAGLFTAEDIECMRAEVGAEFEASITADWVPTEDDIAVLLGAVSACGINLG